MASLGWGKDHSVADWLYQEPYGFDFFQAVRLLELAASARAASGAPAHASVGEGTEPAREAVRFRSGVGLDFPASDVAEVRPPTLGDEGPAARMTVNFMGLAGATGPLSTPSTELVIEREFHGDEAPRAFLDIFNHRLVSLLYRTRRLHRVGLDIAEPGEDPVSSYLYSAAGLGMASMRGRMLVKDRALIFYAGLLAQQPRSMAGLEAILSHYFGVDAVGVPFKGRWIDLEESQWTRIGEGGQNMRLGVDAVAGTRFWDEQGAFEMELGPLTLEQFEDFLPTGWAFRPLCDIVRFYVGDELDFSFRLRLAASEVPPAHLARRLDEYGDDQEGPAAHVAYEGGVRLGWSAWLDEAGRKEEAQVVISPASLAAFESMFVVPYLGLPPDKLQELVHLMKRRQFGKGSTVCTQGEPAPTMFVVRRGSVKLFRRDEDGEQRDLDTLGPGDYFGAGSLIMGKFRYASAVTLEESELFELSKKNLDAFAARYPRFRSALDAYKRAREETQEGIGDE